MKKFEVGKRYRVGGMAFEIISRTAQRAKIACIQHEGNENERISYKVKKIFQWPDREYISINPYELEA